MKINKTAFIVLNLTWGIILTSAGLLVACVLLLTGHRPQRWGGCWYFEVGQNWGGLELGLVFLCNRDPSIHIRCHEYGHAIQNMMFGPFTLLISFFPSVIRYWFREFEYWVLKHRPSTDYDDIWFERTATDWGFSTVNQWGQYR